MRKIVLLLFTSLLIYSSHCKRKSTKKKETVQNVCDQDDREKTVMCVCSPNSLNEALEATCWIYMTKLAGEDPFWDTFTSQRKLQKLSFNIRQGGTLLNVPTTALSYLTKLDKLEIKYALIQELPSFVFANLTNLEEIVLARDQIHTLHAYSFSSLPALVMVNLDENRISEIRRNVFINIPNLRMLYIIKNNLSIIHDFAFEYLNRLEDLELSGNQISVITRDTFKGLDSLKLLDLSSNWLTMIGPFTFQELPNLVELILDQNKIEYISDEALYGLERLTKLRLRENRLKLISNDVFREAPRIYLLDLSYNGLQRLSYSTLSPIWENFKNYTAHLILDRNQLKCDCHLVWVYSLRNETKNTDVRNSLEELTCVSEELSSEVLSNKVATERTLNEEPNESFDAGNSFQYNDEEGEEEEYEDEPENSGYEQGQNRSPRQHVLDIPVEKLPCPETQKATTEGASFSDVISWKGFNSSFMLKSNFYLLFSFFILRTVFFR